MVSDELSSGAHVLYNIDYYAAQLCLLLGSVLVLGESISRHRYTHFFWHTGSEDELCKVEGIVLLHRQPHRRAFSGVAKIISVREQPPFTEVRADLKESLLITF
jgi:hypothetical protein